jgi:hypothetical protein
VKGGGRGPPPPPSPSWAENTIMDGMYARKWPSLVYVLSVYVLSSLWLACLVWWIWGL